MHLPRPFAVYPMQGDPNIRHLIYQVFDMPRRKCRQRMVVHRRNVILIAVAVYLQYILGSRSERRGQDLAYLPSPNRNVQP